MGIFETVTAQMKEALKAKDPARLAALRNIRAAFLNEMKKDNAAGVADEVCVGILRRLEKQRLESIEAFEKAGRAEQAAAEKADLTVIRSYLPSLADEATTRRWVQEAIAASGPSGPSDVGKVMGALMKAHKGEMDGALANRLARELLAG